VLGQLRVEELLRGVGDHDGVPEMGGRHESSRMDSDSEPACHDQLVWR
jgi:hypothetical protein